LLFAIEEVWLNIIGRCRHRLAGEALDCNSGFCQQRVARKKRQKRLFRPIDEFIRGDSVPRSSAFVIDVPILGSGVPPGQID
jgi:hypothetical protein